MATLSEGVIHGACNRHGRRGGARGGHSRAHAEAELAARWADIGGVPPPPGHVVTDGLLVLSVHGSWAEGLMLQPGVLPEGFLFTFSVVLFAFWGGPV